MSDKTRWLHTVVNAVRIQKGRGDNRGTTERVNAGAFPAVVECDANLVPIEKDGFYTLRIPVDSEHAKGCAELGQFNVDAFSPKSSTALNEHANKLYPFGERDELAQHAAEKRAELSAMEKKIAAMQEMLAAAKTEAQKADAAVEERNAKAAK